MEVVDDIDEVALLAAAEEGGARLGSVFDEVSTKRLSGVTTDLLSGTCNVVEPVDIEFGADADCDCGGGAG